MSNNVFANGREISCKSGDSKTICEFPDVCMTPPESPATPPGIPVPYPNTALASDTADGSKSVKISKKEVMLKNKSNFKKSTGDEAGCATKKGIINSTTKGKAYFISWSDDVKVEGENVVRHLDMTTNNHASPMPNGATPGLHIGNSNTRKPWPNQTCPPEVLEKIHKEYKEVEGKLKSEDNCNPGNTNTPKRKKRSDERIAKIPCSRIKDRIKNLEKAIKGREDSRDTCFKNGADPENPKIYQDHEEELQRKKDALCHTKNAEAKNCSSKHPMSRL